MEKIIWPEGKKFAFTVFDDSDLTSLQNGPLVYDFLYDVGIITTKSVWILQEFEIPIVGGSNCQDRDYLKWVQNIQAKGFEIALHNVSAGSTKRENIIKGLDLFKQYFGQYPKIHCNHVGCKDALYWGDARLSGSRRVIYNLLTQFKKMNRFTGHVKSSPFFWGDHCQKQIQFVRNFVFPEINTLKACPEMPYHDSKKKYVNAWFASSDGGDVDSFVKMIQENNQDRLEEEGGLCIMYTHFGKGFVQNGKLNKRFVYLMERLSLKGGWYVPVSEVLTFLLEKKGLTDLSSKQRSDVESRWLKTKIKAGKTI